MTISNDASLRGKARSLAKEHGLSAQEVMQRYFFERFLMRLEGTHYRERFVIKGGLLLSSMMGVAQRTTMDLDATVRAMTLHPHSRHRYLLAPLEAFPSSLGRTDPQSGQTGACPHLSSSPSMVLAPYFSKRFRDCATSHSSANCRSSRPLTSAARSRRASTISAPDILHRPNDHLPGCRQTKKEMADWATLFGWNDYMAAVRVPL